MAIDSDSIRNDDDANFSNITHSICGGRRSV